MVSKAQAYNLNFVLIDQEGRKEPTIVPETDSKGYTINGDLATFIRGLGGKLTQQIIDEITGLNEPYMGFFPGEGYRIEGSYEEEVELFSDPARVELSTGGPILVIPLQDFIDILREWISFLSTLSFQHSLSNK